MGMSAFYGAHDDDESTATLARALDLGVTFFDTADVYGPHTNETLLGAALRRRTSRHRPGSDQVRQRARRAGPAHRRCQRTPGLPARGAGRFVAAAGARPRRPVLPAPRRPRRPGGGDLRGARGTGRRRQGALPRDQRGRSGQHPPRPRGGAPVGGADRVLPVHPRGRGQRGAGDLSRVGHRFRAVLPAGPRLPVREDPQRRGLRRGRLPAQLAALPGRELRPQPRRLRPVLEFARDRDVSPSQLALAWLLAQGDDVVPIPGPAGSPTSRTTCPRSTSP